MTVSVDADKFNGIYVLINYDAYDLLWYNWLNI